MAVGEGARNRFFRWFVQEGAEGEIWDASVAAIDAFISDAVDGVDDEGVGGPEVRSERRRLELTEAASAGKVTAEVDAVVECSSLHEAEKCCDGGIGDTHWGLGQRQENRPGVQEAEGKGVD